MLFSLIRSRIFSASGGVELPRRLKRRLDHALRDAVPGEIEEADALTRVPHLTRDAIDRARLPGERRRKVDHRDRRGRFVDALDRHRLEDVHRSTPLCLLIPCDTGVVVYAIVCRIHVHAPALLLRLDHRGRGLRHDGNRGERPHRILTAVSPHPRRVRLGSWRDGWSVLLRLSRLGGPEPIARWLDGSARAA